MNLKALYKLSCGLYLVSSRRGDKLNGQIANTVFQITSEPPTIAVSINKKNLTHEFIAESKVFLASVLAQDTPVSFIGRFGFNCGRDMDKYKDISYKLGGNQCPVATEHTLAFLEARVIQAVDVGTHTLFIGELVGAEVLKEGDPMTYAYYRQIKGGATSKNAPGYVAERKENVSNMMKYKCTVCGYIYDPELGDADGGIKPGTPFAELPDNWVCPVCGVAKSEFERSE